MRDTHYRLSTRPSHVCSPARYALTARCGGSQRRRVRARQARERSVAGGPAGIWAVKRLGGIAGGTV